MYAGHPISGCGLTVSDVTRFLCTKQGQRLASVPAARAHERDQMFESMLGYDMIMPTERYLSDLLNEVRYLQDLSNMFI